MKNRIVKIAIPLLLSATLTTSSLAITNRILINSDTFSFINKDEELLSNFDSEYEISNDHDIENEDL